MEINNKMLFEGVNQAYYPEREPSEKLIELERQRLAAMQMGNVSLLRAVDMVIDFEITRFLEGR